MLKVQFVVGTVSGDVIFSWPFRSRSQADTSSFRPFGNCSGNHKSLKICRWGEICLWREFPHADQSTPTLRSHSCVGLSSRGYQLWGKYIALTLFYVLLCVPKMLYTESGLLLDPPFKLRISRTLINNIRHLKNTMDTKLSCSKFGN